MSIEKNVFTESVEVLKSGIVIAKEVSQFLENGVVVSSSIHRSSINPGDNYSEKDQLVQNVCAAIHTPEVIEAFKAANTAQGA